MNKIVFLAERCSGTSRKQPPLRSGLHGHVVAYERWSLSQEGSPYLMREVTVIMEACAEMVTEVNIDACAKLVIRSSRIPLRSIVFGSGAQVS